MSDTTLSESPQPEIPDPPAAAQASRAPGREAARAAANLPSEVAHRSPVLAGIFSAILPGFGNVYNGLFRRGLLNFVFFAFLFFGAIDSGEGPHLAILIPSIIFTWLFGVVDAYRQATLLNYGMAQEDLLPADSLPKASGGVAVGVAFFLIGLYGLLSRYFDFDLSLLFDYWYVILMAFGGWMIFNGVRDRPDAGSRYETESYDGLTTSGDAADDADPA